MKIKIRISLDDLRKYHIIQGTDGIEITRIYFEERNTKEKE